ncbi:MAG TPA: DUF4097 family beta strand repeat-containing protein [Acidobacteriaceae bacterium]|nr:DUF4097 family beta strand repeat-containing protein [Acidobacteriaceae bacterium]
MAAPPPYSSQRDYRRMQRDQARWYWRSFRRQSIAGPLLLIGAGVVALLVEMGKLSAASVWAWYLHWWPLLLIAIGLIYLLEWKFDRGIPPRNHPCGGVLPLLLLLLLVAYGINGVHNFHGFDNVQGWNSRGNNPGAFLLQLFGQQHDTIRTLWRPLPSDALIQIRNPNGNLAVSPSSDNQIHVRAQETVYTASDSEAQREFNILTPQIEVNGSSVTVTVPQRTGGHADLAIEIPSTATATIVSGRGDVSIADLSTPVNLTSGSGDVALDRIHGPVVARIGHGDLSARTIGGDLSISAGWVNDLSASGVSGQLRLNGNFFGDISLEHVDSEVHIRSSRVQMDAGHLPGTMALDGSDIRVENAVGPLNISTRSKDISCTGISGAVHIDNRNGEISLNAAEPGATTIENRNGAIHLVLPENAGFSLDATAKDGQIESEFNLPVTEAGRGHTVTGRVGNGATAIQLISDHGDIQISKAAATAVAAAAPAGKIGKNSHRLRAPQGAPPEIQTQ